MISRILSIVSAVTVLFGAEAVTREPIAVFPFRDHTGRYQPTAERIADTLAAEFAQVSNISVVLPRAIDRSLADLGVRSTALTPADIALAAKVHAVERAFTGVVHVVRNSSADGTIAVVTVTVTLTRIGIDEVEAVKSFTANASAPGSNEMSRDEALSGAAAAVVPMIVSGFKEYFAERIRVAAVSGNEVTLSAGPDSGIREQWRFRVIGKTNMGGADIPVRKASVKVVSVSNGTKAAVIRGGNVLPGDSAERTAPSGFRFSLGGGIANYDVRTGSAPEYVNYSTNTNALTPAVSVTTSSLFIDASLTYTGLGAVEPALAFLFFPGNFTCMTAVLEARCGVRIPVIGELLMVSVEPSAGFSTTFGTFATAPVSIAVSGSKNIPQGRAITMNGFGGGAAIGAGLEYTPNDVLGISVHGGYRFWAQLSPWFVSAFNDANESVALTAGIPAGALPSFSLSGWYMSFVLEFSF